MEPVADQTHSELAQAEALREETTSMCKRAGWSPLCIGTEQFKIGISEIYEELRCLQKVGCVDIAEELIECCKRHQQWSPLFEDVEARIALFRGDTRKAEFIWTKLNKNQSEIIRRIADKALRSLEVKRESGEQLLLDVNHALDRNQQSRVDVILNEAVIAAKDLESKKLCDALELCAMSREKPADWPWNRDLFIDQLVLNLFEQQLSTWEDHVV